MDKKTLEVRIDGMTCHSCEILIEKDLRAVPGVTRVDVNADTGKATISCESGCALNAAQLQQAMGSSQYRVRDVFEQPHATTDRPSALRVLGLFALVLFIGALFEKIGFFGQTSVNPSTMSFTAAVILGLVAGTSSCLAVAGGLMLSSVSHLKGKMRAVLQFIAGRVAGYAVLGGLIGWLGNALVFSPFVTGGLTILAAVYMMVMGLEMLKITPIWLRVAMPRMPKGLAHRIMDAKGNTHPAAPFLLGAATFFLPCGFTQALQVYALTTGSVWQSALLLGGFALGTSPALAALGWASNALKGRAGKFFFQFSGALVVVLGIWNIQNGLALAGVVTPDLTAKKTDGYVVVPSNFADPNVKTEDGVQKIDMTLINKDPYHAPSDIFTVKSGMPVRIQVNGVGRGCRSVFQIPKLGVSEFLDSQVNVVEFTPKKAGTFVFSCGMGMYRGTLNVI